MGVSPPSGSSPELRYSETIKMRFRFGRPYGTAAHVVRCPRVPLRSTLGYFLSFPPGTLWSRSPPAKNENCRWSGRAFPPKWCLDGAETVIAIVQRMEKQILRSPPPNLPQRAGSSGPLVRSGTRSLRMTRSYFGMWGTHSLGMTRCFLECVFLTVCWR